MGPFFQKIRQRFFLLLFASGLLAFTACSGASSVLDGGALPPGAAPTPPPATLTVPETPTAIGLGTATALHMEAGAVGPMTDYSKAVLALNCGQSSCVITPPQIGGEDNGDSQACEYTYEVKGILRIMPGSIPMPNRVLRVRDKDTGKFRDVVTDALGQFEVKVTVDPRVEFWATDLTPEEASTEGWTDCADSCIAAHFLKINLSYDPSCSYLNKEPILIHSPGHTIPIRSATPCVGGITGSYNGGVNALRGFIYAGSLKLTLLLSLWAAGSLGVLGSGCFVGFFVQCN